MNSLLKVISAIILSTAALAAFGRTVDQVPNVQVADRTRFTSDPDGYLTPGQLAQADSIAAQILRASTAEVATVIVKDMSGTDINEFARRLTKLWGIGKADTDNGMLLLISVDDRQAGIFTGQGVEGIITDSQAGRIRRDKMNPELKAGRYGDAVIAALSELKTIMTAPEAAEEIRSKTDPDSNDHFFLNYFYISLAVMALLTIYLLYTYSSTAKMERHDRYEKLRKLKPIYLGASAAFLLVPLISYLLLQMLAKKVRRSVPQCPNCGSKMRLIDEVHDNDFLTPAQDREEQLNSVDYDVWHCDTCGTDEIIPYVNHSLPYTVCPNCGSRAEELIANEVATPPTSTRDGVGQKIYRCKNCNNRRKELYRIAKVAAPPVVIFPGGRGGGFGGGGGSIGGGFGGGSFGGGGSSGGW